MPARIWHAACVLNGRHKNEQNKRGSGGKRFFVRAEACGAVIRWTGRIWNFNIALPVEASCFQCRYVCSFLCGDAWRRGCFPGSALFYCFRTLIGSQNRIEKALALSARAAFHENQKNGRSQNPKKYAYANRVVSIGVLHHCGGRI